MIVCLQFYIPNEVTFDCGSRLDATELASPNCTDIFATDPWKINLRYGAITVGNLCQMLWFAEICTDHFRGSGLVTTLVGFFFLRWVLLPPAPAEVGTA